MRRTSSVFASSSSYKPQAPKQESERDDDVDCTYLGSCRSVERFEKLNRIGEGTYGIVYRARDKDSNEIVALKRVRMEHEKNGLPVTSLREINTLKACKHPNIITLYEVVVGSKLNSMFLVFEYAENDLSRILDEMRDKERPFTESEIKCLMQQLLRAVLFLHDHWIIHRDLKMPNLLYTRRGVLKVGDFGLARFVGSPPSNLTPTVITLWYRPPELLFGAKEYNEAIDMWSVGCIFGELLTGKPLFPGRSEIDQCQRLFDLLGVPTSKIWPEMNSLPLTSEISDWHYSQPYNNIENTFRSLSRQGQELLDKLLTYDPSKRINVREALNHPYFLESPLPKTSDIMPTFPSYHTMSEHEYRKRKSRTRPPSPPQEKRRREMRSGGEGIFESNRHRFDLKESKRIFLVRFPLILGRLCNF